MQIENQSYKKMSQAAQHERLRVKPRVKKMRALSYIKILYIVNLSYIRISSIHRTPLLKQQSASRELNNYFFIILQSRKSKYK